MIKRSKRQKVLFMGGFPRAGSTLLANILNQNPEIHTTPTSGLVSSVTHIRDNWRMNDVYKSNGEEYIYPKIKTMLKNMIIGFYENEVINKQLPIDKNRAWTGCLDLLDEIFGCKVVFLYPIRPIGDCMISMETVNRKSTMNNHGDNGNWLNEQTTVGRAENFIKDDGVMGLPMLQLRELIYRGETNRLILVSYNDMLAYPDDIFRMIYDRLNMEHYQHDFDNIVQTIYEQDMHHGFAPNSLHKIKEGKLMPPRERNNTIFQGDYLRQVELERFGDITDFINNNSKIKLEYK
jgi:sulfotransferase